MTPAEVVRAIESFNRVKKIEAQERASYDYILATLISKGVSCVLGDKKPYPELKEAYPGLFDDSVVTDREEAIKEQKAKLSALRFKQFAQSYNESYKRRCLEDK